LLLRGYSVNDYYPFGMVQPGRSYAESGAGYRYGFNGKEKDDEVKGVGNQIDYGDRIYDPRVGRWLSTDPLQQKYPYLTPYNYTANNPIMFYDPDGKVIIIHYRDANNQPKSLKYTPGVKPASSNTFVQQVHEAITMIMKNDDAKTFQNLNTNKNIVNIVETSLTPDGKNNRTNVDKVNGRALPPPGTLVNVDERFNSMEVTISWNPNTGLKTPDGKAQAPSTGLLHEGGHATLDLGLRTFMDLINVNAPTNDDYQTQSDKKIITGLETDYVKKTNLNSKVEILPNGDIKLPQEQGVRNTHKAVRTDVYNTAGVNSVTPTNPNVQVNGTEVIIKLNIPKPASDHSEDSRNLRATEARVGAH